MRSALVLFFSGVLLTTAAFDAQAANRMTDANGHQVLIRRAPHIARPSAARTQRLPRTGADATITVTAGPDTDAANNDYRRIQNAVDAAMAGDTIVLSGNFDFTQPFAAAQWALGDDGMAATDDDYAVIVPNGLNNVTITAMSLGSATIQGPGDLASVDLEGFLFFSDGPITGWTISNLRILDFDLAIGMYGAAAHAFDGTHIQNNFIRLPVDLNATVAPADVLQNIGIHFSYGQNQVIANNTFNIPGDGVSDPGMGHYSTESVMQSNFSGGVGLYDGLMITGNVTHVLNAQSANPENNYGIWENGGDADTGNTIVISGNSFINDAAGNDPALNGQRGFRVTTHAGPTSTVTYDGNTVVGAHTGFEWYPGQNHSTALPVVVTNNTVTNCATGLLIQSFGNAHLATNAITASGSGGGVHLVTGALSGFGADSHSLYRNKVSGGSGDGVWIEATAGTVAPMTENDFGGNSGFGLRNESAPTIVAEINYWGSNLAAAVAAEVSGNADYDPWLASGTDLSPSIGFQPFVYATTSGTLTTFVGTAGADTGAVLAGDPVTLQLNGATAFVPLAQLLNLSVQPGSSDDQFTLGQTTVPTTFDGGPGNDTLIGTAVAQTWNITGAGSGSMPGAASSFTNVESLLGASGIDTFVFGAAGSLAGTLDGGAGNDSLDNTAIPGHTVNPTGPGTIDGFMGTATGVGMTFNNINTLVGSGPAAIPTLSGLTLLLLALAVGLIGFLAARK